MSQFYVTVMRSLKTCEQETAEAVFLVADDEIMAAAGALRLLGGGYADAIDVRQCDAVRGERDRGTGFLRKASFLYCTWDAETFSYDARL